MWGLQAALRLVRAAGKPQSRVSPPCTAAPACPLRCVLHGADRPAAPIATQQQLATVLPLQLPGIGAGFVGAYGMFAFLTKDSATKLPKSVTNAEASPVGSAGCGSWVWPAARRLRTLAAWGLCTAARGHGHSRCRRRLHCRLPLCPAIPRAHPLSVCPLPSAPCRSGLWPPRSCCSPCLARPAPPLPSTPAATGERARTRPRVDTSTYAAGGGTHWMG